MKVSLAVLTIAAALITVATLLAAEAQVPPPARTTYRVGWLSQGPATAGDDLRESFVRRLSELGYSQGRNLVLESRWAGARTEQFPDLAAQLLHLRMDVIVTMGMPATQAVARASQNVPIVMVAAGAAVDAGLIRSLAKPGGNVTGVALQVNPDLSAKRLEFLKAAVPGAARVVYIQDTRTPAAAANLAAVQAGAARLGLMLLVLDFGTPEDFDGVSAAIARSRSAAILVQGSPFQALHAARISELATRNRIPWVSSFRGFADAGALLSYGPSLTDLVVRAAAYVDKILKGATPASLPVEQPTTFELVINLKTAKALGLTIPPSLLGRADHVIE